MVLVVLVVLMYVVDGGDGECLDGGDGDGDGEGDGYGYDSDDNGYDD